MTEPRRAATDLKQLSNDYEAAKAAGMSSALQDRLLLDESRIEAAAKTGVKMVFPLVTCIFPAIWVVTIGLAT